MKEDRLTTLRSKREYLIVEIQEIMLRRKRARARASGDDDEVGQDAGHRSGKEFAFVSYQGPHHRTTAATRRLIHQQAMREIGKTRRRPKDPESTVLDLSLLDARGRTERTIALPSWWLGVRWTLTDSVNMVTKFNVELDAIGKTLLANIFLDTGDSQQRPVRDAWFSVGLSDKAAFLAVLSNSALHLSSMRKGGLPADETAAALTFQTEAVSIINQRLAQSAAKNEIMIGASDGTIGAASGLICNADIRGSRTDWETHLRGVQELVQLRGGIEEFNSKEALRVTLSWVELRGAFMFDVKPLFPTPRPWEMGPPGNPEDLRQAGPWEAFRKSWEVHSLSEPRWIDLMEAMAAFSQATFPTSSSLPKATSSEDSGVWTNPMIHKLLSFRPLQDMPSSHTSHIQESIRLACLLYMASVWRFFGVAPVVPDTLLEHLRSVLEETIEPWGPVQTMEIWTVYMGAVNALDGRLEVWYLDRLVALCKSNGIESWDELEKILRGVLWFACLLDHQHRILRHKVQLKLISVKKIEKNALPSHTSKN